MKKMGRVRFCNFKNNSQFATHFENNKSDRFSLPVRTHFRDQNTSFLYLFINWLGRSSKTLITVARVARILE